MKPFTPRIMIFSAIGGPRRSLQSAANKAEYFTSYSGIWSRQGLGQQRPQRVRIACLDCSAVAMPAAAYHLHPGTPHAVDELPATAEDPAVEQLILRASQQLWPIGRERHHIERRARRQAGRLRGSRVAERLAAPGERRLEQPPACRGARGG